MKKYMDRKKLASHLRHSKQTVVFANGCFDLLHVGHIRYLSGAKKAAGPNGILVVGINTDSSIRKLKGSNRPLMPLKERVELISSLACVDFVTSFSEPNAENTLKLLRPDIQAKGSDYTVTSVPEAILMHSLGGRVVITGDAKNHSTSDLIKKTIKAFCNINS